MKKNIALPLMILLATTGCGKVTKLYCTQDDIDLEVAKMDSHVTFSLDEEEYVKDSIIEETRTYSDPNTANDFILSHQEAVEKIDSTKLIYKKETQYVEKVLAADLKKAMEGQGYTCSFKK